MPKIGTSKHFFEETGSGTCWTALLHRADLPEARFAMAGCPPQDMDPTST